MSRQGAPLRLSSQDGYTALEMIVTMALTAIVSGAIFSSFLVLERVQAAWEQREQARAVGVLAEQPLLRDVQAYRVSTTGNVLVLDGVSTQSAPFKVTYSVQTSSGRMVLNRSVKQANGTYLSNGIVAHGVQSLNTSCSGNTLTVGMQLDAISTRGNPQPVQVSPVLKLTPRNGC
jgi:prepilin-type N-terminal cleavage/methylation domain-containing protein